MAFTGWNPRTRVRLLVFVTCLATAAATPAAGPAVRLEPPRDAAAAIARVDSLLEVGSAERAASLALQALAKWAEDPLYGAQIRGRVGVALLAVGRPAEALPHLEQAVARNPRDASWHHQLGLALSVLGRTGRALAEFEQAIEADPRAPGPRLEAGRLRGELGDWRRARTELEAASELCGGCPEADRLLGSVLMSAGRPGDAVEPFGRLWAAQPDSQVRHHLLGALAASMQDSALMSLVEATPVRERTRDDWRMAVLAESRRGGARWAAEALAVADSLPTARFPNEEALFWAQGALNLYRADRLELALAAADRALNLDAEQPVYHHNRAAILAALGRDDEARRALETAGGLEKRADLREQR